LATLRAALALGALGFLLAACHRGEQTHRGPIVLITFSSLRADMVGGLNGPSAREPRLTPQLDGLLREADWGGRAVAASSESAPSLASLWTGLRPWQHGSLHGDRAALDPALWPLPVALRAAGYRTFGYVSGYWASPAFGYGTGFDSSEPLRRGEGAMARLAGLDGSRQFVWIHLPEPEAPYVRREGFLNRLAVPLGPAELPRRVERPQLEPYFDPSNVLPPEKLRRFAALYRLNVAWADNRLGELLAALRRSGQWNSTLLVVTADHGIELGERHQILHGGNLGRRLLEVPLAVKLPAGFARPLVPSRSQRVAAPRIWATLVEAAGGSLPPAVAPSLFRQGPAGILSELYRTNGTNRFSWLQGDDQLLWEARFAPPDPDYYRARLLRVTGRKDPRIPVAAVWERLDRNFAAAPPLSGIDRPRLTLERWDDHASTGSFPLSDLPRQSELAAGLAAAWQEFVPAEKNFD
jgi:arylsulfatase A-like enzyme